MWDYNGRCDRQAKSGQYYTSCMYDANGTPMKVTKPTGVKRVNIDKIHGIHAHCDSGYVEGCTRC